MTRTSVPHRMLRILGVSLFSLAILVPTPLDAQDPQSGLSELEELIKHEAEPVFALRIPAKKKAFKPIRARWRQVDLDLRRDNALRNVDEAIAGEREKETPDEARIQQLEVERYRITNFYQNTRVLLEVDGDPQEFVRVTVQPLEERNVSIAQANPKSYIESKWSKVKIITDREVTSGADKRKKRQGHSLMLFGTPENSTDHGWWRIETRLIPSKDGKTLYQLQFVHRMPADRFDKKTAKEDELLLRTLVIP